MSAKGAILVIDDEQEIRESLEELLKLEGYDVSTASTAREGLRKVEERVLDLVLLDIGLPDSNGLEVLKAVKSDSPDTSVVMITAQHNNGNIFIWEATYHWGGPWLVGAAGSASQGNPSTQMDPRTPTFRS